jgi:hypothetical protein
VGFFARSGRRVLQDAEAASPEERGQLGNKIAVNSRGGNAAALLSFRTPNELGL